jgi:hypothetical protein
MSWRRLRTSRGWRNGGDNGCEAKIGSVSVGWEHFSEWKGINDEGEQGVDPETVTFYESSDHEF